MKKAVIATGGKQYLVAEGDKLNIELVKEEKSISFEPLLVINEDKVSVGKPTVAGSKVTADILDNEIQEDKVTSIRYKAKKRVKTIKGHRQKKTTIQIKKIS